MREKHVDDNLGERDGIKGVKKCVVNTGSVNVELPFSWTVFMSRS